MSYEVPQNRAPSDGGLTLRRRRSLCKCRPLRVPRRRRTAKENSAESERGVMGVLSNVPGLRTAPHPTTPCHATPRHATPRHATPRHATLRAYRTLREPLAVNEMQFTQRMRLRMSSSFLATSPGVLSSSSAIARCLDASSVVNCSHRSPSTTSCTQHACPRLAEPLR